MIKTTVTIVVEHYERPELIDVLSEVFDRISGGYSSGTFEKENQITGYFKIKETEA